MNILCLIKQVPDSLEVHMGSDLTLQRDFVAQVLNNADESAVELALQLRDQHGGTVTAMTMGPARAEGTLRELVARGVDHIALLTSPKCAGSDTLATARALAKTVEYLGPFDLILFGRRAADGETGQVGPMTAALLDIPCIANCVSAHLEGDTLCADQLTEDGNIHWQTKLPAAITMCDWSYALRLPTLMGLRKAKKADIRMLTPEEIGLDVQEAGLKGSPTRVVKASARPAGVRPTKKITVQEAVEIIRSLEVVP